MKELTFTVTEDGPIADVDVRLAIRQENAYEIFARLVSPSGKEAILVKYQNAEVPGENGKHFQDTYLDDEADDSINSGFAPFAGTEHPGGQRYRLPEGSLGVFDGENARGVWKLQVADNRCFARTGAVNGIIKRGQRTDVPGWMNALAPSLFQLRSFTSSSSKLRRSEFRAISEKY